MAEQKKRKGSNAPLIIFDVFLLAVITGALILVMPKLSGLVKKPTGPALSIEQRSDGWLLDWSNAASGKGFTVTVLSNGETVYTNLCDETSCLLPVDIPQEQPVTIRVTQTKGFRKTTEEIASSTCYLHGNREKRLSWIVDPEQKTLSFTFTGGLSDTYHLYLQKPNGSLEKVSEISYERIIEYNEDGDIVMSGVPEKVQMVVRFGDGADYDFVLPEGDESYTFVMDASRTQDDLVIYELKSDPVTVTRSDFIDMVLVVDCAEVSQNSYRLTWNETAGSGYEVQELNEESGEWDVLATIDASAERVYNTGTLTPCHHYTIRVVPAGRSALPSASSQVSLWTHATATYATIWPTKNLGIYDNPGGTQIASAEVGQSFCVLDEYKNEAGETTYFRVSTPEGEGYIDSNYCMINLPEYIGDMCRYDIKNSYYSIYLANVYAIPEVSGVIVPGYENILLNDHTFVVPLLYPVANRLITAAQIAREEGYIIKIYDSFRPHCATRHIYDKTAALLDMQIPSQPFTWVSLDEYISRRQSGAIVSVPAAELPSGAMAQSTQGEDGSVTYAPGTRTYGSEMLGGTYSLGAFLAARGSMHNVGVAMDLTFVRISDGSEITAQTRMHNLSYHSIQANNSGDAQILKDIMEGQAGFSMITSEWWHFQDNEVRDRLNPPSVENGVSIEGWKKDDNGWKYRLASGEYYVSTTAEIGGVSYTFDARGYTSDYPGGSAEQEAQTE